MGVGDDRSVWRPDRFGPGVALLRGPDRWLEFRDPLETRFAHRVEDVLHVLRWADEQATRHWLVGWVAFEAAPAFDPALVVHPSSGPLAVFSAYEAPTAWAEVAPPRLTPFGLEPEPGWTEAAYVERVNRLRDMIGEGRVYQVNLTFPLDVRLEGDPADLFCALVEGFPPPHAALLGQGDQALISLSPELFVRREGSRLTSQPMKGTRPAEGSAEELASHPKDRAENLMIVDMIRNDLGRIALPGTVQTRDLFHVARHGTVLQMTSAVEAEAPEAGLAEVFQALFPCASVTGAPKVEALRVIHELEDRPRGAYCGAIGWVRPGGDFSFNVAIRTLQVTGRRATYSVGSGVVWDSDPEEEWRECLLKSEALRAAEPWHLLETLLWQDGAFVLLHEHLHRMERSAIEAGFRFERATAVAALNEAVTGKTGPQRVRLLLGQAGGVSVEVADLIPWASPLRAALCPFPVRSDNPWLRHKSTRRGVYERARAACPGVDEVLLWNERGELCEFTQGNVVVEIGGVRLTPPLESGTLPGVARAAALEEGEVVEQVVRVEDLALASHVWLVNSVRGWVCAEIQR